MKRIIVVMLLCCGMVQLTLNAQEQMQTSAEDELFMQFDAEYEEAQAVYDPLSGYNQTMTRFNDLFYMNVLNPVAMAYGDVVHENIRTGVANVFDNLFFPIRFINNVLQLKFAHASEELGRFVINSTFGLLGIMDVAKDMNLKPHKEDFGQTLGYYGVGSGFHVVLPFLGPSNLRDIVGLSVDTLSNPTSSSIAYEPYQIPNNSAQSIGLATARVTNNTSLNPNEYEKLKELAVDLYPFLRDLYEQKRKNDIEQ